MMSMYSLYRAWLLRDTPSIASPSLSLPPDLYITLPPSPHQFIAHRSLVSSHSGWLKTAITTQEAYAKARTTETEGAGQPPSDTHPYPGMLEISLPSSIPADIFSPLLTFMYTGYLDLNLQNIYELLLAVNILQMPHALDLCRSYLLHNVHSVANFTFNNNHLPKPIPASFNATNQLVKPFPTGYNQLAKPVPGRADLVRFPGETLSLGQSPSTRTVPIDISTHTDVPPSNNNTLGVPPTSLASATAPLNSIKRDGKIHKRRRHRKFRKLTVPRPRLHDSDSSDDVTVVTTEVTRCTDATQAGTGGYGVDIASCDGPVHFTRVLNEHYNVYNTMTHEEDDAKIPESGNKPNGDSEESNSETEINIDENSSEGEENEENIARNRETEASFRVSFRHQIQRQSCGGETGLPSGVEDSGNKPPGSEDLKLGSNKPPSGGVEDVKLGSNKPQSSGGVSRSNQQRRVIPRTVLRPVAAGDAQRSGGVRLLDMNVQYYPCKTCGAKFPSYYFVHKHRRRAHPEEEGGVGGEQKPGVD